jgi:hypothetical protein
MSAQAPFPLGDNIWIESTAHKSGAWVTVTMDNSVYTYAEADYDWVGTYGVYSLANVPSPAPYYGHKGTDITAGAGSPIYAISGGTVTVAGGTYNELYIDTGDTTDCYLHMNIGYVGVGDRVESGQQIGTESGWGGGGSNTYGAHLHLDRFVNSVGRGDGTIDSFNYSQGAGGGGEPPGEVQVWMIVNNIDEWNAGAGKIGVWNGGGARVRHGAHIFISPSGAQVWMEKANGQGVPLHVWKSEYGVTMEVTVTHLLGNRCQVSVYDQLGAFHPTAWIDIGDINW